MSVATRLAGTLFRLANAPGERLFRGALDAPRAAQEAILWRTVRANADTAFGREHGFAAFRSVADYRARVPLRDYAALEPWIARIAGGEERVLTRERVVALEPSSGSTAAVKRLPYTAGLQRELRRAIAPWLTDVYRSRPGLAGGAAYWSITPTLAAPEAPGGGTPGERAVAEGFAEDSDYLGGFWKRLVDRTFAVPAAVRFVADLDAFRYVTLLFLLRRRDLALISVWHPSFLVLLLDALPPFWAALLADVAEGRLRPPSPLPEPLHRVLADRLRPLPGRARELARLDPGDPAGLWPRLELVSCWGDGPAAGAAADLAARLPGIELQRKGLLATEAFVTFPYAGRMPLAIRSHFFELLPEGDRSAVPLLPDEVEEGGVYTPVVTTAGGLYRYLLGDRVQVDGFCGRTPSLRFLGRADQVVDLRGEKLSEGFVADAFRSAFASLGVTPRFALLAPDPNVRGAAAGYTAYVELPGEPPTGLCEAIVRELSANPCFAGALRLGQLDVRVFAVRGAAYPRYAARCRERGQRLGDVKPLALSGADWSGVFPGGYLDDIGDRVGAA